MKWGFKKSNKMKLHGMVSVREHRVVHNTGTVPSHNLESNLKFGHYTSTIRN